MVKVNRLIIMSLVLVLWFFFSLVWAESDPNATGIHKAALEGDLAAVKTFLKKDANLLNADGWHRKKPLHWAAQGGHTKVMEFLLAQGAVVDSKNEEDETPLHYAAAYGKKEAAELLLTKGADPDVKTRFGTPLIYAANGNHPEVFKLLIEKGADVTATMEDNFTLLHYCAWRGSKEIILMLLGKGIPADAKTNSGRTPLQNAAQTGNLEAAEALIAKGADVNHKDDEDLSPLYLAVKGGYKDMVTGLLDAGASVDARREESQQTSLHMAALKGYGEISDILLSKGADPNVKDINGFTPLDLACRYGNKKAAKILISKGAKWTGLTQEEKAKEYFAFSPLLQKEFKPASALVWYLGHSGWAIKTANHLLIFDYYKRGLLPDTPLMANGTINPEEIKDLKVTVFVSHDHGDHYIPGIFDWRKEVKDITYIMGFKPGDQSDYIVMGPRETKALNGMEITAIESNDSGVGFFVKVDGVNIFHSGDHANRKQDFSGPFKKEIEFLAEKDLKPDIFFAPVSGCGFGDLEAVKKGVFYTIKTLSPKVMAPMHAITNEHRYVEFAKEVKKAGFEIPVCCAGQSGDWFFVHQGEVKKAHAQVFKEGMDKEAKACTAKTKEKSCNH